MSAAAEQIDEEKFDGSPASPAALPTLLSVMFINLLGFGIVVPLLAFYGKSFGASPWHISLIFSAYAIGAFFGEPFWGRLSDRIGRKPILISTVTGNCLCYMAMAFAPNVYFAIFARILGGLMSGNGSVIQGYIADVTPPAERSAKMSLLGAAFNLGFIVGPALGGLLANPNAGHAGFRAPFFVCSSLSAICVIGLALFVKESRVHIDRFTHQPSRWAVLGNALTHPIIARLMLVTFLAGCAFTGIESIFGLWTQTRFGWEPPQVGLAFGVVGIVAAICQIWVTGRLSKRYGEARMLALGMAVVALFTMLQPSGYGAITVVTFLAFTAFGQSVAWPNVSALISRNADVQHQGQYLGLNNAVGALSRVIGPSCMGFLFSGVGVNAPFYFAGLLALPAIALAWSARRRRR
jgi:DHA1 family tetracycline resistance protein-like MFS transporter